MKRLIRKQSNIENMNMVEISEFDEADVKNDRCPNCPTTNPLQRKEGFKVCNDCGSVFKLFDGDGYIVS